MESFSTVSITCPHCHGWGTLHVRAPYVPYPMSGYDTAGYTWATCPKCHGRGMTPWEEKNVFSRTGEYTSKLSPTIVIDFTGSFYCGGS